MACSRSVVMLGSPFPRIHSVRGLSGAAPGSTRNSVSKRYSTPSRASAAAAVTSFTLEAGFISASASLLKSTLPSSRSMICTPTRDWLSGWRWVRSSSAFFSASSSAVRVGVGAAGGGGRERGRGGGGSGGAKQEQDEEGRQTGHTPEPRARRLEGSSPGLEGRRKPGRRPCHRIVGPGRNAGERQRKRGGPERHRLVARVVGERRRGQ